MEETKQLQVQLDLMQAALDHINQGFSVFDADLRLVAWNRGLTQMLDFPQELASRGTHLEAFLRVNAERGEYGPGDIEGKIQRRVERARKFEPHYFERVRPNGQVIAISGTPLPQGGFVTTYSDITESRRKQERLERTVAERTRALQQSEDWLRLVTDNIPALIAYVSPGPVFRFANRRYADWFGQSIASIAGQAVPDVIGPELYAELAPHISHAFSGNAVSYEYQRGKSDGSTAYMRSTLIPDMTADGRTLGIFVLSLDATDQKHAEEALVQSQRMDAVGKLAGGLAHDFNNLLAIMMGNLLSLSRMEPPLDDGIIQPKIETMLQATKRGSDLTQRLLAFSRGKSIDPKTVALQQVFSNVGRLLTGSLPRSVDLSVQVGVPSLEAKLDPTQLETALINLAFNARDAMPEGGTIDLKLEAVDLDVRRADELGLAPGWYAMFSVADTGKGMDAETQKRIFEPFFTTKHFGTGSGLGLSMVYGFVRQSGGVIKIASTPGSGTTVRLYLPARAGALQPEASMADIGTGNALPLANGELLLLVEDDEDVATSLIEQLEDLGYAVLRADGAEDARKLAIELPELKVVLSDIIMPGQMNGFALAQEIRSRRSDVGVALMTGYADWSAITGSEHVSGFPVLRKPFGNAELAATLRDLIHSKTADLKQC